MSESEDKIVLKTDMVIGSMTWGSAYKTAVCVENLLAAFGETYMQAINIGWETKALDALFEAVRKTLD